MKRIALLVFLIGTLTTTYAQQGVMPYDVLMRSGKVRTQAKDYDKAIEFFTVAVENYPDQPEAHYWLGTLYHDRAAYKDMMTQFRKFEEIYENAKATGNKKVVKNCEKDNMPKQIREYTRSAFAKEFASGVEEYNRADSLAKESANLGSDSARTEQEKLVAQLFNKADGILKDCLTMDDTVADVYTYIGLIANTRGDNQVALEMFRKARQLSPDDNELLVSIATTFSNLRQLDSAAVYYGAFAEKDSLNREIALSNQAMCYQAINDDKRFEETLDKIIKINPQNTDILYQRGFLYIRKASAQSFTDSAATLDSIARQRPGDKAIERAQADLLEYRVNLYRKALPDFKTAAEQAQTDPEYWYWYGTSAMLSDKTEEAREAYAKCVEVKPDSEIAGDCWCQLALLYAKLQMQKEFDEATAKCPKK